MDKKSASTKKTVKNVKNVSRLGKTKKVRKRVVIPMVNSRGDADAAQNTSNLVATPSGSADPAKTDTEYHVTMGHPCSETTAVTAIDDPMSSTQAASGISDVDAELFAAFERAKADKEDTISIDLFYDSSNCSHGTAAETTKKKTSKKSPNRPLNESMSASVSEDINVASTSQATMLSSTLNQENGALLTEVCAKVDTKNVTADAFEPEIVTHRKHDIYTEETGPKLYNVYGKVVSRPIVVKRLPQMFEYLPIHGRPDSKTTIEEFQNNKIREFIGCDISDEEYESLAKYCSPDHLRTGNELVMSSNIPMPGLVHDEDMRAMQTPIPDTQPNRYEPCVVKKCKMRMDRDPNNQYITKLKYRGMRLTPLVREEDLGDDEKNLLEPGKDILLRVRVYRPFSYHHSDRPNSKRHSLFTRDQVLVGTQTLAELRDRFMCCNDLDIRVDVSENPDQQHAYCAKDLFPSGFLFINNVFYVDDRKNCKDMSTITRAWAAERGLGVFPRLSMSAVRLQDMVLRLGHPEVYVHQGNCEHLFTFSEVRLVGPGDALRLSSYPCSTAASPNHTMYCTTCAEFAARWVVTGSQRVPFDPAYFCDQCYREYMCYDGQKVGEFKAFSYMGNELNINRRL